VLADSEILAALDAIDAGSTGADQESEQLEFKREGRTRNETAKLVAREAIALANTRGGAIVLGVDDRVSGPKAMLGTRLPAIWVKERIFELTKPRLALDVAPMRRGGQDLLVIRVPESLELHAEPDGRAHRRVGTQVHAMTPADQRRHHEDRRGSDWSDAPSQRRVDDIAPEAVAAARRLLAGHRDAERRRIARRSDRELLAAVGATRDGRLTRAGELLFCESAEGEPHIVCSRARTPGGEPDQIVRAGGPGLLAFEEAMRVVDAQRRITPLTFPDGFQAQLEDIPATAVREAVSNAFVHRDHQLLGPCRIAQSPQRLDVTSPGPLVAGVTPDNILSHDPKPRNARLARAARTLGLAEEIGQGVDRMYRDMLTIGKDPPRIDGLPDSVRVSFAGGAPLARVPAYLHTLPAEVRDDVDTLLVLSALLGSRTIVAATLAPAIQRPTSDAQEVLHRLSLDPVEMIEATRGTARRRFPTYRLREEALRALGPAVRYTRRSEDEIDRKVVAHMREYEHITNRTVRNLFDLDVHRARDLLTDLVRRGVIVKTSKAQRGPSVEYGRGPNFPERKPRRRP